MEKVGGGKFNPFHNLDLEMPTHNITGSFASPQVKKAYRALAKKYHPDKVYLLSDQEQE